MGNFGIVKLTVKKWITSALCGFLEKKLKNSIFEFFWCFAQLEISLLSVSVSKDLRSCFSPKSTAQFGYKQRKTFLSFQNCARTELTTLRWSFFELAADLVQGDSGQCRNLVSFQFELFGSIKQYGNKTKTH